jgi:hypothetical protein
MILIWETSDCYSQKSIHFLSPRALELSTQIGLQDLNKFEINNKGEHIKKYAEAVWGRRFDGYYYCYAFQFWAYSTACNELNIKNDLPKTGHCLTGWNIAVKNYKQFVTNYVLEVNSILIWASKKGNGHAGRITKILDYDKWIVQTLEANTSKDGSNVRNGGYVTYKKRYLKNPLQKMLLKGSFNAKR